MCDITTWGVGAKIVRECEKGGGGEHPPKKRDIIFEQPLSLC